MEKLQLEYLKPAQARGYDFYLIPKLLIDHEAFDSIDYGAKILYGLMLSRASLSATNVERFTDEAGRLFIIYTVEQVIEDMRCSKPTAIKMIKQLDDIGLIEKKRQGQGKPSIIFVKDFASVDFLKSKIFTSRSQNNELQEVQTFDPNYNDFNKNNFSENQSIIQSGEAGHPGRAGIGLIDRYSYDETMELLKEQVDYDILCHPTKKLNIEEIDEMLEIMCDTICSTKQHITIGGDSKPIEIVRSRLLKLSSEHLEYVADSMEKTTSNITNIRAYLLSALYNAPTTFSHSISAQVRHDMPYLAGRR